jgi:hypothetical protein
MMLKQVLNQPHCCLEIQQCTGIWDFQPSALVVSYLEALMVALVRFLVLDHNFSSHRQLFGCMPAKLNIFAKVKANNFMTQNADPKCWLFSYIKNKNYKNCKRTNYFKNYKK